MPAPGSAYLTGSCSVKASPSELTPYARAKLGMYVHPVLIATGRRVLVSADATADREPEVQESLTERIFPRQADVITVADLDRAARWRITGNSPPLTGRVPETTPSRPIIGNSPREQRRASIPRGER